MISPKVVAAVVRQTEAFQQASRYSSDAIHQSPGARSSLSTEDNYSVGSRTSSLQTEPLSDFQTCQLPPLRTSDLFHAVITHPLYPALQEALQSQIEAQSDNGGPQTPAMSLSINRYDQTSSSVLPSLPGAHEVDKENFSASSSSAENVNQGSKQSKGNFQPIFKELALIRKDLQNFQQNFVPLFRSLLSMRPLLAARSEQVDQLVQQAELYFEELLLCQDELAKKALAMQETHYLPVVTPTPVIPRLGSKISLPPLPQVLQPFSQGLLPASHSGASAFPYFSTSVPIPALPVTMLSPSSASSRHSSGSGGSSSKRKPEYNRPNYSCGRCGQIKRGHNCPNPKPNAKRPKKKRRSSDLE